MFFYNCLHYKKIWIVLVFIRTHLTTIFCSVVYFYSSLNACMVIDSAKQNIITLLFFFSLNRLPERNYFQLRYYIYR